MVKIKSRDEILKDVIRNGKKHPKNWKAVFGKDNKNLSNDYYIFNPKIGIFLLKEYQKNPFEIKGIGGKIARHVDEDLEIEISKYSNDFGIIQGDYKRILKNLEKGVKPKKIFDAALKGKKDLGIRMPIRGHASSSTDIFNNIHNTFSLKQKKLDLKFEKMATEEGLYNSYD
jgi:hypothetical protein